MGVLAGIAIGTALALLAPELVLLLRPGLEPAFGVTMFLVGTLVRPEQLDLFFRSPARALSGLLAQYTIMPLAAFAFSRFFEDPAVRTGVVLVGCMPGAMASNVMSVLLRGDLVLSVTLTTLATFLSPLVLSLWLPVLADARMEVPVLSLARDATVLVVLPVAAGIALRRMRPDLPPAYARFATAAASAAIVLIVLVVVAANRGRLANLGPGLVAALVGLNASGYALAWGIATALGWPPAARRTLVVEVGMQNAGLGSVLALAHLGEAGAVPSACYTVLCVITASLAVPVVARRGGAGPG